MEESIKVYSYDLEDIDPQKLSKYLKDCIDVEIYKDENLEGTYENYKDVKKDEAPLRLNKMPGETLLPYSLWPTQLIHLQKAWEYVSVVRLKYKIPNVKPLRFSIAPHWTNIITSLENDGVIETKKSTNTLCEDEREFKIKGSTEFFLVDCLGTTLCTELSNEIMRLWNYHKAKESKING